MQQTVARGEMAVVLWESVEGLELKVVGELEVGRWKREMAAVLVSPAVVYGYRVDPPLCSKCMRYGLCHDDMAADDPDEEGIDAALALVREQECWAINDKKLLADAAAASGDDLEAWAAGA